METNETTAIELLKTECTAALMAVVQVTKEKAAIEAREKELKSQLREAMEKYGVKKFETDLVTMTYIAPTTSAKLDSKKLREKYPKIADEFTHTTNVSAYVKIALKGGVNDEP